MQLLRHYSDLAYMGFVQVVLHLRTILRASRLRNAIDLGNLIAWCWWIIPVSI